MSYFKEDEVLVLLGAGASVDAGIPHSTEMIDRVEELVDGDWDEHRELYNFIKSAIYYGDGVRGEFRNEVNYNIERLVNTLEELRKKEEHPLYPFVGAWIPKLNEVSGDNFENITDLRDQIVGRLRERWLSVEYPGDADYYRSLEDLQQQYEHPLRVFTLNYDLCVEENCSSEIVERGFEDHEWDWGRFELRDQNIYLYKLHGSTDWVREDDQLIYRNPNLIDHDEVEIIFGTTQKMQYVDPFLFLAYELRRWTLSRARLIISIGYGFGDDHINDILGQALRTGGGKKLLSVAPIGDDDDDEDHIAGICRQLQIDDESRVICRDMTAEEFMEDHMDLGELGNELFPEDQDLFIEVSEDEIAEPQGGQTEDEPVPENPSE